MTLTLQLSHPSSKAVSYSVNSSMGGTATVSDDYADFEGSPSFGVITVPAGDRSAEFDIAIIDDNVAESNETITIRWVLGANSPATPPSLNFTGTITDNDSDTDALWSTTMTVGESTGGQLGYTNADGGEGTLDDRTFRLGGENYKVSNLFVLTTGELRIGFNQG